MYYMELRSWAFVVFGLLSFHLFAHFKTTMTVTFLLFANGFLAVVRIAKKYYDFYTNYPPPPCTQP
jgi:hypothetical protein